METLNIFEKKNINSSLLLLIISFIFISFYVKNNMYIIVSLSIAFVLISLNPIYIGIPLYLIASFSTQYFVITPGLTLSRSIGIALIISILLRIIIKQKLHINMDKNVIFLIMLMFCINIFSISHSSSISGSIVTFLLMTFNFIIFLCIIALINVNEDLLFRQIVIAIIYTIFFVSILIFTTRYSFFDYQKYIYDTTRFVIGGERGHASELGRSLAQTLIILFYYILTKKQKFITLSICSFAFLVGLFLLLGTGSRTSFAGLILGLIIIIAWERKKLGKFNSKSIFFLIAIIGVIAFYYFNKPLLFYRYSISSIMESQGTGRFIFWDYYLKHIIPNNFWFGIGIGGDAEIQEMIKMGVPIIYQKPAHNMVLSLLVELGIGGCLLYMTFFIVTLKRGLKALKENYFILPFYSVFSLSLLMAIGEPMYSSKIFWVSIAMIWRYSFQKMRRKDENIENDPICIQ